MRNPAQKTPGPAGPATGKGRPIVTAVVCVAMLGASMALGLAIRQIRSGPPEQEPAAEAAPPAQPAKAPEADSQPNVPAPTVREEPQAAAEEATPEVPQPQAEQPRPQMARRWGGPPGLEALNLTEEEQARLREAVMAMFQRLQNMTEEERQTQMARFNAMRERFEGMSDEQRQQAMGRVQQQIEQWRQNGGSAEDLLNSLTLE
jgi:hypothetical protein